MTQKGHVASGISLGAAWALLLGGGFSIWARKRRMPGVTPDVPSEVGV